MATNGIAECPKSICIQTLAQGTYDLNFKKIRGELKGLEHTQEIYAVAAVGEVAAMVMVAA